MDENDVRDAWRTAARPRTRRQAALNFSPEMKSSCRRPLRPAAGVDPSTRAMIGILPYWAPRRGCRPASSPHPGPLPARPPPPPLTRTQHAPPRQHITQKDAAQVRPVRCPGGLRPRHRRRGRCCVGPGAEDRSPGSLPEEDRRGYCQGDCQGLEGSPCHRQADGAEPPGQGVCRAVCRSPGHSRTEGAAQGPQEGAERAARWKHFAG